MCKLLKNIFMHKHDTIYFSLSKKSKRLCISMETSLERRINSVSGTRSCQCSPCGRAKRTSLKTVNFLTSRAFVYNNKRHCHVIASDSHVRRSGSRAFDIDNGRFVQRSQQAYACSCGRLQVLPNRRKHQSQQWVVLLRPGSFPVLGA